MRNRTTLAWATLAILGCLQLSSPAQGPKPVGAVAAESRPANSQSIQQHLITPGRQTTRITEPLDDEGYVDYLAALNERHSAGVTPETNAAVELVRVFGPQDLPAELRSEFFARLGIEELNDDSELADDGQYFVRPAEEIFSSNYELPIDKPWKPDDDPQVYEWLQANEPFLDRLVLASQRQQMYVPLLASTAPRVISCETARPVFEWVRIPLANGLRSRATLRMQEGKTEAAIADLLAVERWARHVGSMSNDLSSCSAGIAISHYSEAAWSALLNSPLLTAAQAKALLKELNTLGPVANLASAVDIGERYMALDGVQFVARNPGGNPMLTLGPLQFPLVDWNQVLRNMNVYYDLGSEALAQPQPKRAELLDRFNAAMEQITEERIERYEDYPGLHELQLIVNPRETTSTDVTGVFAGLLVPAVGLFAISEQSAEARAGGLRAAVALIAFERTEGQLPDTLEALCPAYLEAVPTDPFTGEAMLYERTGQDLQQGFTVYSVGWNGRNDGGSVDRESDPPYRPLDLGYRVRLADGN